MPPRCDGMWCVTAMPLQCSEAQILYHMTLDCVQSDATDEDDHATIPQARILIDRYLISRLLLNSDTKHTDHAVKVNGLGFSVTWISSICSLVNKHLSSLQPRRTFPRFLSSRKPWDGTPGTAILSHPYQPRTTRGECQLNMSLGDEPTMKRRSETP